MQQLIEYLISRQPRNEVIRMMYGVIIGATRAQAETLTVTRDRILFGKSGVQKAFLDIGWHERKCRPRRRGRTSLRNTCFRDALALIVEHDAEARKHLELVEATPERVTYRIVFHEQDE